LDDAVMAWRVGPLLVAVALAAKLLTGCESGGSSGPSGRLTVVAGFYPLAWMAEVVGGRHVEVESLTAAGQEPHDLELAARDVAALVDAEAVVYLGGFQPAVDEAADQAPAERVYDAAPAADLDLTDEGGAADPHFWLDPIRFVSVVESFTAFLSVRDPAHEAAFAANRDEVVSALESLDADLRDGLASCEDGRLVTSHDAFGYLAARYGFEEIGITGLSPEAEPSPADVADVIRFVDDHDVRTVYVETLVSPDVADAIAEETGARTAVLDPIEGLTGASEGGDYLEVMRANLATLREGQACR
jgi:zinc transport system substrate-binding protein